MTTRTATTSPLNMARVAGLLYLLTVPLGIFTLMVVPSRLIVSGDAAATAGRIMVNMLAHSNQNDLVVMRELLEAGKVVPVIDRCYPLSEVAQAIRYLIEEHARGKVVITVDHNSIR